MGTGLSLPIGTPAHPRAREGSRGHPPRRPAPRRGGAYLANAAGVVLGLGAGPEQAGGRRGRPELQDPAEVRGVGGGAAGRGRRRRVRLPPLGGQAELLGGPGGDRRAALGAVPVTPPSYVQPPGPAPLPGRGGCGAGPWRSARPGQARGRAEPGPARPSPERVLSPQTSPARVPTQQRPWGQSVPASRGLPDPGTQTQPLGLSFSTSNRMTRPPGALGCDPDTSTRSRLGARAGHGGRGRWRDHQAPACPCPPTAQSPLGPSPCCPPRSPGTLWGQSRPDARV